VGAPPERGQAAHRVEAFCLDGDVVTPCTREVIAEEPLRIVVNGAPVATLMRTPGGEVELAVGFLVTEGLVGSAAEVATVSFCPEGELGPAGEVRVQLSGEPRSAIQDRYRETFSSCSLCGLEMIEAYADDLAAFDRPPRRLCVADVFALRDAMDAGQTLFRGTGGSHAAALAELPLDPAAAVVGEDLGRHNALDKAVGAAARQGVRLEGCLLMLSGRPSFEMVAKAARAGLSDVAAVGAPSALGVALARRLGMFLAGFVRGQRMTVYSGLEALALPRRQ
jgi:FdhD protein